jgi:hypothetical protein
VPVEAIEKSLDHLAGALIRRTWLPFVEGQKEPKGGIPQRVSPKPTNSTKFRQDQPQHH